jgi:hypothetical protein
VKRPATCHPAQPAYGRGLCRGCYDHHRDHGTLDQHPRTTVPLADFAADYQHLRTYGHTRRYIATRIGMTRDAVDQAYRRAVRAGLLTPDRRTA